MLKFSAFATFVVLGCFGTAFSRVALGKNAAVRDIDLGVVDDFQCSPGTNIAAHPELCQFYYLCNGNETHLMQCTSDLVFDLVYYGCNYLYLTDCGSRIPPFKCPADGLYPLQSPACDPKYVKCVNGSYTVETCPSGVFDTSSNTCSGTTYCPGKTTAAPLPTAPGGFVCPEPDGQFPSPWTCTQFYVCVGGVPLLQN